MLITMDPQATTPIDASPVKRMQRNLRMAWGLLLGSLLLAAIGVAVVAWTPAVLMASVVLLLAAGVYAIMANASRRQSAGKDR